MFPIPLHKLEQMTGLQTPFSDWLRKTRESVGLTQQGLADSAGVTKTTISRYENGIRAPRSIEDMNLLADALAGPYATEDEKEKMREAARAASAGINVSELERIPEEMREIVAAYNGIPSPSERARFLRIMRAAIPTTGDEPREELADYSGIEKN